MRERDFYYREILAVVSYNPNRKAYFEMDLPLWSILLMTILSHPVISFEKLPVQSQRETLHSKLRQLLGTDCQVCIIRSSLKPLPFTSGIHDLLISPYPLVTYSGLEKASHFNCVSKDPVESWFKWSHRTKRAVKFGSHCYSLMILQPTEDLTILELGNPAVDNYFFMLTKKSSPDFLHSARFSLNSIKFKFLVTPSESQSNLDVLINFMVSSRSSHFLTQKIDSIWLAKFETNLIASGKHLRGSAFFTPNTIIVNSSGDIVAGSHFAMIQTMSKVFNFTYDLYHKFGHGSGHLLPNGTWTGFMGDLVYKKKDFATVMVPLESRYAHVDMTTHYEGVEIVFFTRRPRSHINWKAMIYPFKPSSWLFIVIAFTIVCILIYVSLVNTTAHHSKLLLVTQSVFIPFSPMLDQSASAPVQTRVVLLAWLIPVFILGSAYKGKVTEFLTIVAKQQIPRTFRELDELKDYHVYFFNMRSTPSVYFANTRNKLHQAIAARFEHIPDGGKCMLQAFLTDNSVCVGVSNALAAAMGSNLTINNQADPMVMSKEKLIPMYLTIGLQKNSIYTKTFDLFSSTIRETGLWKKWDRDNVDILKEIGLEWLSNEMKDSELRALLIRMRDDSKIASQLQLRHYSVAFVIGGLGVFFAIIVYVIELANVYLTRFVEVSFSKPAVEKL